MLEDDSEVLWCIGQCWFGFEEICPMTYVVVVVVVSKVDKDESKEESDLLGLACELDIDVTETHVVEAGRLAGQ
jgi:hypothetical protein